MLQWVEGSFEKRFHRYEGAPSVRAPVGKEAPSVRAPVGKEPPSIRGTVNKGPVHLVSWCGWSVHELTKKTRRHLLQKSNAHNTEQVKELFHKESVINLSDMA